MTGILIVLIILLCFMIYIMSVKQRHDQIALEAYNRIILSSTKSELIYQQVLKSAKLTLKTDNPTDSNSSAIDAIEAYNKLAGLLDSCKVDLLLVKPEKLHSASNALAIIQNRVNDSKERVDDVVRYVKSIPNTIFTMSRCPIPCYADTSQ